MAKDETIAPKRVIIGYKSHKKQPPKYPVKTYTKEEVENLAKKMGFTISPRLKR